MSQPEAKLPIVQLVSKPITPPFRDGSKCLVRDLCLHLSEVRPHVLGTGEPAPELGERAVSHSVYRATGGFSPGLRQNLQAARFMLMSRHADLWHFVFAPNPRSSQVGGMLRKLRGVPTVQTIASPPRSFARPSKLLFGDVAVAQSEWTRAQFLASYGESGGLAPRMEVIPPPAPEIERPSQERCENERARLGLTPTQPLFLYPGDLEVSEGAAKVVAWSKEIRRRVPDAWVFVAYRDKTAGAALRAEELAEHTDPTIVRFECNVPDIHALVATSTAILFPVEDLYGKVDLPIVLLEAMRFGTPVLALNHGPLASLLGARLLSESAAEWLEAIARVASDVEYRTQAVQEGLAAVTTRFAPSSVARQYEKIYADLLRK